MRLLLALLLLIAAVGGCLGGPTAPGATSDTRPGPTPDQQAEERSAGPRSSQGGFSDTDVFPGEYRSVAGFSGTVTPGPFAIGDPESITLESALDAASIHMVVVRPVLHDENPVPVILQASPYYDDDTAPDELTADDSYLEDHYYAAALVENFVPHGYAVALLAVRGSADSGGCIDVFGPREQADLDQAVTWLGTQGWSNGNVGMFGLSYDGSTPWMVAATGNPHLRTIVPLAGVVDLYDLGFRNGTWTPAGIGFTTAYWTNGLTSYRTDPPDQFDPEQAVQAGLCPNAAAGLAAGAHAAAGAGRDPRGFFQARDHRGPVENRYNGSVFLVHGFHDPNVDVSHPYPWVHRLEDRGLAVKHLLGQWEHWFPDDPNPALISTQHNPTPRFDFAEVLLHWFDYWLKEDRSRDLGPRVQVADTQGQWRSERSWPPEDARPTVLHLSPALELQEERSDQAGSVVVGADPLQLPLPKDDLPMDRPCAGCAIFSTQPLSQGLRFAGAPHPHLTVTPLGPSSYLTAELYTVDPDGAAALVTDGQMDLRFHRGGEDPQVLMPGEAVVARMALDPIDAVVPPGGRLVLVLSQGSADGATPAAKLFAKGPAPAASPVEVQLGQAQSLLTLRTFQRGPEAFFEPPTLGTS